MDEEKKEQIVSNPKKSRGVLKLFLYILICIGISFSTVYFYDKYYATKVVKIDFDSFMEVQVKKQMKGEVTSEESIQKLKLIDEMISQDKNKVFFIIKGGELYIENAETFGR